MMKPAGKKHAPAKVAKPPEKLKDPARTHYLVILLLCFVFYGNTIPNRYALDDLYVITGNKYTKEGFEGIPGLSGKHFFAGYYGDNEIMLTGGRYRPFSMVTFAIEYEFFGENPHVSHFFNVILFALCCILLYVFLRKLLKISDQSRWYHHLPLLATLLFLAHPVHTEVVANLKGRDEILSLTGALLSGILFFKYLDSKKIQFLLWVFPVFLIALLSKENAAVFLVLIPLAGWFFREKKVRELLLAWLPMLAAFSLFLIIRTAVLSGFESGPSTELLDNPFLHATASQKAGTILFTLGLYVKLLFVPYPLTWDYYPYHIQLLEVTDVRALLSLLLYLFLLFFSLKGLKEKKLYSWLLLFYLGGILPVSNILFPVGVFMAERFLFMPSVAFCVLAAWLVSEKLPLLAARLKKPAGRVIAMVLAAVLIIYVFLAIDRNGDWKDDFTLYTTDVKVSSNSAKSNNIAGQWYAWAANQTRDGAVRREHFARALALLQKAVQIHPAYQDAWFHLGNVYYDYLQQPDSSLQCYLRILRLDPEEENVYRNLGLILKQPGISDRIGAWKAVHAINPARFEPNYNLGLLLAGTDREASIAYMEKASLAQPENPDVIRFLQEAGLRSGREAGTGTP